MVTPVVDLSATFAPVRDQGDRPACLAISISDAHAKHRDLEHQLLSAEYLFRSAAARMAPLDYFSGLTLTSAQEALLYDGQPPESIHPYIPNLNPAAALPPLPSPLPAVLYRADSAHGWVLGAPSPAVAIAAECDQGRPVVLVLHVTRGLAGVDGPDYVVRGAVGDVQHGLHGVVALGHGMDAAGARCIRIRNSWGSAWADQGHAWLHETYLAAHLNAVIKLSIK